jgi:hypothetical protein
VVAPHALLELLLGDLGLPAPAPDRVLRLEHLRDVVDLVVGLDLGRARRLPVEVLARRALGEQAEQHDGDEEEGEEASEDDGHLHARDSKAAGASE